MTDAVQTTIANQPPLDLTSNPLRIGASAGTSLVATLPSAIADGIMLRASGGNVYQETMSFTAGQAYNVVSNQGFAERVILAADTPAEDVEKVKANMVRAWKASGDLTYSPELITGDSASFSAGVGGWAALRSATVTHGDGVMIVKPQTQTRSGATFDIALPVGRVYSASFRYRLKSGTAQQMEARLFFDISNASHYFTPSSEWQVFSRVGVRTVSESPDGVRLSSVSIGNGCEVEFDDISIREVLGGA